MRRLFVLILLMSCTATVSWADTRTAELSVPSMNCAMCPITVRKALERVDGVTQVRVDYESKIAAVVFDDKKTNVDQLIEATQNAGYPSTEIK